MTPIDKAISLISPVWGARRALARLSMANAARALMHYEAAQIGARNQHWTATNSDADAAADRRDRLAFVARDLIRNNPHARRGRDVIVNNVVGEGIIPKILAPLVAKDSPEFKVYEKLRAEGLNLIERHLDKTAIDAAGRLNLYGIQSTATAAMVESGEVLVVARILDRADQRGKFLPLSLQVLEMDYLDTTRFGPVSGRPGHEIWEGIEYDAKGRRFGYWLFREHPGTARRYSAGWQSDFWPAQWVAHLYRVDRPGQERGVSWFAPVILPLQDLGDYMDAQIMRQKVAAAFTAFRTRSETAKKHDAEIGAGLIPGTIQNLEPDETIEFTDPPGVDGFGDFVRVNLSTVAAGLGISYEALTGDLRGTNFASGKMGRLEMDRSVSSWQQQTLVPQLLDQIGVWFLKAWMMANPASAALISQLQIEWSPPLRVVVDPSREFAAQKDAVRAGFISRRSVVRSLGHDPERIEAEIVEERAAARAHGIVFDTDAGQVSGAGIENPNIARAISDQSKEE